MLQFAAEDLKKRFGQRVLFRNLSFVLEAGQSLAVTGANGAGKSTLLKILAGVLHPSDGRVALRIGEKEVSSDKHPLRVGFVAPYINLYEGFSARENLSFLAKARRLGGAPERIRTVLEEVGLLHRADDLLATFSSGMQQRVKYAAALLADPPLLLLDEPTANLDEKGLAMVERVEKRQQEQGRLLVVATNNAEEAARHEHQLCVEDFR